MRLAFKACLAAVALAAVPYVLAQTTPTPTATPTPQPATPAPTATPTPPPPATTVGTGAAVVTSPVSTAAPTTAAAGTVGGAQDPGTGALEPADVSSSQDIDGMKQGYPSGGGHPWGPDCDELVLKVEGSKYPICSAPVLVAILTCKAASLRDPIIPPKAKFLVSGTNFLKPIDKKEIGSKQFQPAHPAMIGTGPDAKVVFVAYLKVSETEELPHGHYTAYVKTEVNECFTEKYHAEAEFEVDVLCLVLKKCEQPPWWDDKWCPWGDDHVPDYMHDGQCSLDDLKKASGGWQGGQTHTTWGDQPHTWGRSGGGNTRRLAF